MLKNISKASAFICSNPVFPQQLTHLLETLGYTHNSLSLATFFILLGESKQWVSSNIIGNHSFIRVANNDTILHGGNCSSHKNIKLNIFIAQLSFLWVFKMPAHSYSKDH